MLAAHPGADALLLAVAARLEQAAPGRIGTPRCGRAPAHR